VGPDDSNRHRRWGTYRGAHGRPGDFLSLAGAVSFVSLVIGIIAFVGVAGYCPYAQVFIVATNKRLHA
jgi:hypothetical protein